MLLLDGAGELEYTEEPLIMDRTLLCRAPNREDVCEAGDASRGGRSSGRGVRRNNGKGIVKGVDSGNVLEYVLEFLPVWRSYPSPVLNSPIYATSNGDLILSACPLARHVFDVFLKSRYG